MKKFTILLMLIVTSASFAQLKKVESKADSFVDVGKIQPLGMPNQMYCRKDAANNIYAFSYQDMEYKSLVEYEHFFFKDVDNAFDSLYDMIIAGYKDRPEKSIELQTEHNVIWVNFVKSFGMTMVTFSSTADAEGKLHKGTSNMFTKKQIEKLFGKNK